MSDESLAVTVLADHVFAEHWELLAQQTRVRHEGDLALFAGSLATLRA
jgi:hypothetical protein